MPVSREKISIRLISEGQKNLETFRSFSTTDWEQPVYTTGSKWIVRQILSHFVSTERAFQILIRNILDGGSGTPRDFDLDHFNEIEALKLAGESIDQLLGEFEMAREKTSQLVAEMSDQDLNRIGNHPWFGEIEIESMLKLIYRHNMIHLRDVRRALETKHPVPHQEIAPPVEERLTKQQ
jgi:hypothetical protein